MNMIQMKEEVQLLQKIECAKLEINQSAPKKTGKNNFNKYDYYQLGDILPAIRIAFKKQGLASEITYPHGRAQLIIYDVETGAYRKWDMKLPRIPSVTSIKDVGKDMQLKGAVQTYARRYLYLTALEIAEGDAIDAGEFDAQPVKHTKKSSSKTTKKTGKTTKTVEKTVEPKYNTIEEVAEYLKEFYNKNKIELTLERGKNTIQKLCESGEINKELCKTAIKEFETSFVGGH